MTAAMTMTTMTKTTTTTTPARNGRTPRVERPRQASQFYPEPTLPRNAIFWTVAAVENVLSLQGASGISTCSVTVQWLRKAKRVDGSEKVRMRLEDARVMSLLAVPDLAFGLSCTGQSSEAAAAGRFETKQLNGLSVLTRLTKNIKQTHRLKLRACRLELARELFL